MLVGDGSGPGTLVRLAALTCVVGGTVADPLVAGLDDETLRTQLVDMVRQLIELPAAPAVQRGRGQRFTDAQRPRKRPGTGESARIGAFTLDIAIRSSRLSSYTPV